MFGQIIEKATKHVDLFTVLVAIPAAGLLYIVYDIIYNIFFYPLAQYLGPFLAKITNGYAMYHANKGDMKYDMYALHQKHGKYVRYGPNRLLVNSGLAVKDVYAHSKPLKKSIAHVGMRVDPKFASSQSVIDKVEHGRKRKLLSSGFSDASMRGYNPTILAQVRKFCNIMREGASESEWSTPRDMGLWSIYLAYDVMGALMLGRPFNMLGSEEDRPFVAAIEDTALAVHIGLQNPMGGTPWGHRFRMWPALFLMPKHKFAGLPVAIKTSAKLVKFRKEVDPEKHLNDIFSHILAARDPETGLGFTEVELIAESRLLIIAGSDTSSACMSATFFFLMHNTDVLKTLITELDSRFKSLSEITPETVPSCKYLRAVIDEALRLVPPVGSALWREAQKDIMVDNITLPRGVEVGVPIYTVHHNSKCYPEPFAFKPERWLQMSSEDTGHLAFCPFSIGPRGCVGKNLAYAELHLMLARTVYMFDMKLAEGQEKVGEKWSDDGILEYNNFDNFTTSKEGPVLRFRQRKGAVIDE